MGVVGHSCQWGSRPWPGRFNTLINIGSDIGTRELTLWSRLCESQIGDAGQHPSGNLHGMHRSGQERLVPLSVSLLDAPMVACSSGVAATVHQPWAGVAMANLRPWPKSSRKQKVLELSREPYAQVDCNCDARQKQRSVGRCFILVLRFFRTKDSFSPMTGVRIGEATNPGPLNVTLCVLNPTSVLQKTKAILDIKADIYFLSETSATKAVQKTLGTKLLNHGDIHWGEACPPRTQTRVPDECLRGDSLGVAIYSRMPVRLSRNQVEPWLLQSCRYMERWIKIAHLDVLVICIYAKVGKSEQINDMNRVLLNQTLLRAQSGGAHVIVAGDFNSSLEDTGMRVHYETHGFIDMLQWARQHKPNNIRPTCLGTSYNDTILIKGPLSQQVIEASVLEEHAFAAHLPFVLKLSVPQGQTVQSIIRYPKDWSQLEPDTKQIAEHYQHHGDEIHSQNPTSGNLDSALRQWATNTEAAVALTISNGQTTQLPANFAGRCREQPLRKVQNPAPPKPGGGNHYEPFCDVASFAAVHKTRQVRRLKSIHRQLLAWHRGDGPDESQIRSEWLAISKAKGYLPSFPEWVRTHAHPVWHYSPYCQGQLEWILCITAAVEFDCDQYHILAANARKKKFEQELEVDWGQQGGKFTCRIIKQQPTPVVSHLETSVSIDLVRCRISAKTPPRVYVLHDHQVKPGDRLLCLGEEVVVGRVTGRVVHLTTLPAGAPARFSAQHRAWHASPEQVIKALEDQWKPVWNRDQPDEQTNRDSWDNTLRWINSTHAPQFAELDLDVYSVPGWRETLKRTKRNSAKGPCGFSSRELMSLPDQAFEDLFAILKKGQRENKWPQQIMNAKTIMLVKNMDETLAVAPSATRPITILSMLFRIWSKVLTRALLKAWSTTLPKNIAGGMIGRTVADVWWQIAATLDRKEESRGKAYGYVLDLKRCFNELPRLPLTALLIKLGAPKVLAEHWARGLMQCQRYITIKDAISNPIGSTNGVPEGDPMGVPAVCALAALWMSGLQHEHTQAFAFADNFEYLSDTIEAFQEGLQHTTSFMSDWKQIISFDKSWAWGNTPEVRTELRHLARVMTNPNGQRQEFTVRNWGTDLGATVNYSKARRVGTQEQRFTEAGKRASKAATLPLSLLHQTRTAIASVLPVALPGCEILFPSAQKCNTLRSAMAKMFVGSREYTNPWLACSCLPERIVDPEYHVIYRVMTLHRQMLAKVPSLFEWVWSKACRLQEQNYTGVQLSRMAGPAVAVAKSALLMGWTLNRPSAITDADGLRIELEHMTKPVFQQFLQRSWNDYITSKMLLRKEWQDIDSVDVVETARTFHAQTRSDQLYIRHALSGSLCGDNQRAHLPGENICPHCGQEQHTLRHTLWECSATGTTRGNWQEWLDASINVNKASVEYPFFPMQQEVRDIWAMRMQMQIPKPQFTFEAEAEPIVWTDGSMNIHARAQLRESSWAIVTDKCVSNQLRQMWAAGFHDVPPDSAYRTLQCGYTPGHQTIARAELMAVCVATQAMRQGTIVTDSQYVVQMFRIVKEHPDPLRFWNAPNYDLLQALCAALADDTKDVSIQKIKSHQKAKHPDAWQRYLIKGNRLADQAAGASRLTGFRGTTHLLRQAQVRHRAMQSRTTMAMACRADLERSKTQSSQERMKGKGKKPPLTARPGRDLAITHLTPNIDHPRDIRVPRLSQEHTQYLYWGETYMNRLGRWVQTLKWPPADDPRIPDVTWYELLLNFKLTTQSRVPVNLGTKNHVQYAVPDVDQRALLIPLPLAREMRNFRDSLCVLEKILQTQLFPADTTQKAQTFANVTGYDPTCGFKQRPQMLLQDVMRDLVLQIPYGRPQQGLPAMPVIPKIEAAIAVEAIQSERATDSKGHYQNFRRDFLAKKL